MKTLKPLNVPLHLFRPEYDTKSILHELAPIFDSGWTGLGAYTKMFEKSFAHEVGAKYSVAFNSATSALHCALKIAGVKGFDTVVTTPLTFVSTNAAILYNNAIPIWCDVDPKTLNLDFDFFLKNHHTTIKPKAIVVVHYGGLALDMDKIYQYAKEHDIWVIEDAAHACGSLYKDDTKVGNCPYEKSLTVFSFHAVKNLPIGDGGAITTNSEEAYQNLKRMSWMGINKSTFERTLAGENRGYNWMYEINELGYKYHMNDIQAAIGLVMLRQLQDNNAMRRNKATFYLDALSWGENSNISIVGNSNVAEMRRSCHHLFVVKVSDYRNKCIEGLNALNIFPGVHYYPNHLYNIFKKYYFKLPVAEQVWQKIISLPMHRYVNPSNIDLIIESLSQTLTQMENEN